MSHIIDYSHWRPEPAYVKHAGVLGVVRYLSYLPNAKVITKTEYDALLRNGLTVSLVWEQGANDWQKGDVRGALDGAEARRQARILGFPDSRPIFAAYDSNVQPTQLSAAVDYQRGFNRGAGGPQGAYSTGFVLNSLFDLGFITVGWQTNARGWYGNRADCPRAALFQRYNQFLPGLVGAYDLNDVNTLDWGQVPTAHPEPPAPPVLTKGATVDRQAFTFTTDSNGCGWTTTQVPFPKFRGAYVQGAAPTRDKGYWGGSAHGNDTDGKVLLSVVGARPLTQVTVFINVDK